MADHVVLSGALFAFDDGFRDFVESITNDLSLLCAVQIFKAYCRKDETYEFDCVSVSLAVSLGFFELNEHLKGDLWVETELSFEDRRKDV